MGWLDNLNNVTIADKDAKNREIFITDHKKRWDETMVERIRIVTAKPHL